MAGAPLPVREYATAEENRQHAVEVRRRLFAAPIPTSFIPPRPAKPSDFIGFPEPSESGTYAVRALLSLCAEVSGFPVIEIRSQRRSALRIKARFIAYWLAKQFTTLSLPQIGRHIGGRDHSTIHHGLARVERVILAREVKRSDCPKTMAELLWAVDWRGLR